MSNGGVGERRGYRVSLPQWKFSFLQEKPATKGVHLLSYRIDLTNIYSVKTPCPTACPTPPSPCFFTTIFCMNLQPSMWLRVPVIAVIRTTSWRWWNMQCRVEGGGAGREGASLNKSNVPRSCRSFVYVYNVVINYTMWRTCDIGFIHQLPWWITFVLYP